MKYAEVDSGAPVIAEVVSRVEDRFCTLRWRWPDGVQAVCIHKASAEAPEDGEHPPSGMKLYTREEYKANNGYRDRLDEIGLVAYTIYARLAGNGRRCWCVSGTVPTRHWSAQAKRESIIPSSTKKACLAS